MSGVPSSKPAASADGAAVSVNPFGPEVVSVTPTSTDTGTSLPFGGQSVSGSGSHETIGGVASTANRTVALVTTPLLVAVQVRPPSAGSVATVTASQPSLDQSAVCASAISQVTVTGPVYQPLAPSGPSRCGVITGGVAKFGHVSGKEPSATTPSHASATQAPPGSLAESRI